MWPDNETEQDFLNFTGVAETVGEIVIQAQGRPISIGVSGAWGVGKSSMIKLIRNALGDRTKDSGSKFVFVEFNAWLYQGYDDARAALMDVIASTLGEEAEARKSGVEKTKELLKRVEWLRVAKIAAGSAVALAAGLPPVGLLGEVYQVGKKIIAGEVGAETIDKAEKTEADVVSAGKGIVRARASTSPPKEIHALRKNFEEALDEMGITLVVLIDDLDRCLPETTISTLEAIRLFLFLKNTAFVIAADNEMIKHAVKRHFDGVSDDLVTSYFDKLIQVPIRVPPLGTQEVRAYMMLLFVENSALGQDAKERIRAKVCTQLSQTWQGKRVDRAFIQGLGETLPNELVGRLDTADRLAPMMIKATGISGNPRLIKRFLNALAIRMAISKAQGVGVDETVLVKMLLFERCGHPKAYAALTKAVTENEQGKPGFLSDWEAKAHAGQALELEEPWNDPFIEEWLALPPRLGDRDLRGVLYVSREHAPLITPEDRLSSDAAEVLNALLEHPDMAASVADRFAAIQRTEMTVIMDRLLDHARQEQEWGVPPILEACLVVSVADPSQGSRLAAFLSERPPAQIRPNIVPKIADQPWSERVFATWNDSVASRAVKNAIRGQGQKKHGNVAV
jgi:predicted KAP-like P-loop ATPase